MTPAQGSEFGDLLRHYRRDRGLTQEELAERATVSVRAISDLERGLKHRPRKDTVQLLVDALQLSDDERNSFQLAARAQNPSHGRTERLEFPASTLSPLPAGHDAMHVPDREETEAGQSLPIGGFLGALPDGPLVARIDEMIAMLGTVEAVERRHGRLMLVAGEAGIGKTRLAQEVTRAVYGRKFLVAAGRCYEPQRTIPYYPFLEVLRVAFEAAPASIRIQAERRWSYLSRLLPEELGTVVNVPSRGPEEQELLFRAVTGFLQAIADVTPVAILLDDLHWADSASLQLLHHLARQTRSSPVLVLGTYRNAEVGPQHPLEAALRDLSREQLLERVTLRRLEEKDTAAFISTTMGTVEAESEFAALVHHHTDGNPFFTQQVLRMLIENGSVYRRDGAWQRREMQEIDVPESVRSVIAQRVARLDQASQEILHGASVLGPAFSFDDLLATRPPDENNAELEDAIDTALTGAATLGLMRMIGRDRYSFDHALTQQALYAALSPRRRRRLHLLVGSALEKLPERKRHQRAAELAWHFLQSDDAGRALPYAMLAGNRAETVFAHAEAEGHYRTSLELAIELGDDREEARALERLGHVLKSMGRIDEALAVSERAAQLYKTKGDLETTGRVVAHIGQLHGDRGTFAEGERRIRAMLAEFAGDEPSPALAALYSALERLSYCGGHYGDSLAAGERAAELARILKDDRLLAYVDRRSAWTLLTIGHVVEARRLLEEVREITDRLGDPYAVTSALQSDAMFAWATGSPEESLALCQRGLEVAEHLGDTVLIGSIYQVLGAVHFDAGEWDRAEADLRRALALLNPTRSVASGAWALGIMAELLVLQGRWGEARERLEECRVFLEEGHEMPVEPAPRAALALFDLLHARPQSAIDRFVGAGGQSLLAEATVCTTLPYLAWAQLELGELDQAEATVLAGIDRGVAQGCLRSQADALCIYGMVLNRQKRWQAADETLELAVITARRLPYPFGEAHALYAWGRMSGQQSPVSRRRLMEALAIFQRLGAEPFVALTREALSQRAAS